MIDDVSSYSVGDFISFSDEVYLRLFERQIESWWPAHLLLLATGVAALIFAWLGKNRSVAILLALPLLASAIAFHFQLYAEITPVGQIFGWAFLAQALLILVWGFVTKSRNPLRATVPAIVGTAIAGFGLAIYPSLALLTERRATEAEFPGMAPDPTVCLVLGILLMSARPLWALLLFPIPMLWAATTGATLHALEFSHSQSMMLPVLAAAAVITAIYKAALSNEQESRG